MNFGIALPKIENWDVFEELCFDLLKMDPHYENVNRYGRKGQKQKGIDIIALQKDTREWLGIQCKVKEKDKINKVEIQNEIEQAYNINPKLSKYLIFTTAKRDVHIQDFIREKSSENIKRGLFNIDIKFWEDISEIIKHENYQSIHYKYYKNYFTQLKEDGFSFGKLVELTIGEENFPKSCYPVLIGKTFSKGRVGRNATNYWKDVYYIINFNARKMEVFPIPCHSSDLEAAFDNILDRYIITKLLNSIKDMDKFLESDEKAMKYILNRNEVEEFLYLYSDE